MGSHSERALVPTIRDVGPPAITEPERVHTVEISRLFTTATQQASVIASDARKHGDAIVAAAQAEADQLKLEASKLMRRAREATTAMLEEALGQREAMLEEARRQRDEAVDRRLQRIATLTDRLIEMAEGIVGHAEDPVVACAQLAQFTLALTDAAELLAQEAAPTGM